MDNKEKSKFLKEETIWIRKKETSNLENRIESNKAKNKNSWIIKKTKKKFDPSIVQLMYFNHFIDYLQLV